MMLASPLLPTQPTFSPQHTSDDSLQYRPAKDIDAFNSLLPPAIEFVEGSSSGALAVPPGKYEPINASPKASKVERLELSKLPPSTPVKSTNTLKPPSNITTASLYTGGIDCSWPPKCIRGNGLYNSGNTCFLNSALQCLLHTPPLLRILIGHKRDTCPVDGFCMSCNMRQVMVLSYGSGGAFSPTSITSKLQTIAKHMRRGRQEDSHEFLRYAIDALQKSCLVGHPSKIDPKLAETTWVHRIFGGQLRSRVTCGNCDYNSDTFDRILDLSVDIHKTNSLRDALRKFVAIDYLKGADKYKCEKCKKPVVAEKRFTLHEAPVVLTVHLKRFSPLGRKISHHVQYEEHLSIKPYMSEGCYGPSYSLYGVICHAGGGPNSGHYYAFIKGKDGRWWEMNDESVTLAGGTPINKGNAYMLFYMRRKGEGLEAAVNLGASRPPAQIKANLIAGMKRKERDSEEKEAEDKGVKVSPTFIGPLLPSPSLNVEASDSKRQKPNPVDPQAALVKHKIEAAAAAQAQSTLTGLSAYASGSEDEGEKIEEVEASEEPNKPSPPPTLPPSSSPIPASAFYGTKKRKSFDADSSETRKMEARRRIPIQSRSEGYSNTHGSTKNPYTSLWSSKNRRPRPRGV